MLPTDRAGATDRKDEVWTKDRATASLPRGRSCCVRLQFFNNSFEAPNPSA